MFTLMTFFFLFLFLSSLIMLISQIISKKEIFDREKSSPFECGFNPKSSARLPFSLRFFLIAVIFLIFDVEISILLPIFVSLNSSNLIPWLMIFLFFIFILLLGLYHEWNKGMLNWTI